jgi:predicted RNase H-like HicB family nuclease
MAAERRHVILTPVEDGWWMANVPSLPGCVTQGSSKGEALENVKEAIQLYIESLVEDGEAVPEDVAVESAVVVVG